MSLCVTTVVSADRFAYFIPMFVYTVKRAYPEYDVKIFVRGKLPKHVAKILEWMRQEKVCKANWRVHEKQLLGYGSGVSACNSLRHLLPPEAFSEYSYLYITDIDFLVFRHNPTHLHYFQARMHKQCYAAFKGPSVRPRRPSVNGRGWRGDYTRVADGNLMLKIPQWFDATNKARMHYQKIAKLGHNDGVDRHPFASYREYNEVMLYRMLKRSGIKTPRWKYRFLDGKKFDNTYRDIHLGDFKFARRWQGNRIKSLLRGENIKHFRELEKDPVWQHISQKCSKDSTVDNYLHHLRKHVEKR